MSALPEDPTTPETFTFRGVAQDGSIHEIELSGSQALDLIAGLGPLRELPPAIAEDGSLIHRESAIPETDDKETR